MKYTSTLLTSDIICINSFCIGEIIMGKGFRMSIFKLLNEFCHLDVLIRLTFAIIKFDTKTTICASSNFYVCRILLNTVNTIE